MPCMICEGFGGKRYKNHLLVIIIIQHAYLKVITSECGDVYTLARMHHKVVGNFRSEADVPSLYNRR